MGSSHFLEVKQVGAEALALNPRNAEAHSALGYIEVTQPWNWDEGLRETEQAIALAPNDAEIANFAGDVYRSLGDFEQATQWERRALELDPLLPINHVGPGLDTADAGPLPGGDRARTEGPGARSRPAWSGGRAGPGATSAWAISTRRASSRSRLALADPTLYSGLDLRARIAIKQGRLDDARKATAELQRRARAGEMVNYVVAQLEVMLGDNEAAARSLSLAYTQRDPFFPADDLWLLPEDWPDHPGIRATLDKPELKALFDMRRKYFKAQKMSGFK